MSSLISSWVNGVRSSASSIEQFFRLSIPDGPYASVQLGLQLSDSLDGITLNNLNMNAAASGDCVVSANCDAEAIGSTTEVYFGRLEVQNSFGAETSSLEVPLRTMVLGSSGYVVNTADDCSLYQASGVTLSNYQDGLPTVTVLSPSGATNVSNGTSTKGSGLILSSPGATNTGSVDGTYDAPSWLEFDWQGSGLVDPVGTAIFGQFRGHDTVIYWREIY